MKQKGVFKYFGILLILTGCLSVLAAGILLQAVGREDRRAASASEAALLSILESTAGNRAPANEQGPGSLHSETGGGSAENPAGIGSESETGDSEPVVIAGGKKYLGYLSFSGYDRRLPVLADWRFEDLRLAPVRYAGTAAGCDLVIAGHNNRSHFHILHSLKIGDRIIYTDARGVDTPFDVRKKETLDAADVEHMTSGDWDLTLFTCTPGGKARLAVRCVRVS